MTLGGFQLNRSVNPAHTYFVIGCVIVTKSSCKKILYLVMGRTLKTTIICMLLGLFSATINPSYAKSSVELSRQVYQDKFYGFWLGQSIGNWTGLITEMDKVGTEATMPFYTDQDWGRPDLKAMWGEYVPHADRIGFYFERLGTPWGADDDTDIEFMYLYLHHSTQSSKLSAQQIVDGWLTHIYSETDAPIYQKFADSEPQMENFLWVSNQRARELMELGFLPPETSEPANNSYHSMIDAQLTTELFGLLAPGRPDIALELAYLPIRTTAKYDAQWIAQFYVVMHSLAATVDDDLSLKQQTQWLAEQASFYLPSDSTSAGVYKFVKDHYQNNPDKHNWELTRDAIYQRYQLGAEDGYVYSQPFDAVINFAASLVSLFYGQGDMLRTLQIGTLAGWDSDNPTATWGGLLGFLLGKEGVEEAFAQDNLSETFWIHRTRRNFPDYIPDQKGEISLQAMSQMGVEVVDRVIAERLGGTLDKSKNNWIIPQPQ